MIAPSARKWPFKVEMADALEVQSCLIQRLVGLFTSQEPCDYRISSKGGRGSGPLSLLLIYSSFLIRDQSRQSEKKRGVWWGGFEGVGGGRAERRTEPKGGRAK